METNVRQKTLAEMKRLDGDLLRFTAELVRTESVNPPGNEARPTALIEEEASLFGLTCTRLDHGEGRSSVMATLKGTDPSSPLLFSGHTDTVPFGEKPWTRDPLSAETVGGKIYGRGSADMKGGVAAMLYAMAAMARAGYVPSCDITLVCTAGEEVDSLGALETTKLPMVRSARGMLIAEPSGLDIYVAEKGAIWLRVDAGGKTAHGSMPEKGVNAVEHLAEWIPLFSREWARQQGNTQHPLLGRATASVNMIKGGVAVNVIPDAASAFIDIRTLPGRYHMDAVARVESCAKEYADKIDGLSMRVETLSARASCEIDPLHPLVESLASAVGEITGREPARTGASYYTDASVFGEKCGFPIVICGPGEASQAHQPDEWVDVEKLRQAARIFALWAIENSGGGR